MGPYIGWPWWPPYGGVGVQPLLTDDCYTVEQQIMRLNWKVKYLEEHGGDHDYTELIERVSTLESEYNSVLLEIQSLSSTVQTQGTNIDTILTRIASIETNLTTLSSSIDSLESDIIDLTDTVQSQGSSINALTNRVGVLESELIQYIGNVSGTFTYGATSDIQVIPINHTIAPLEPNRTYYILPILQAGFDPSDESMVWMGDSLIIAESNSQGQINIHSSLFGYKGTASSKAYSIRFYALSTINNL